MNDPVRVDYVLWVAGVGKDIRGPGGWAAILTLGTTEQTCSVVSGGDDYALASDMEPSAIIAGLARVPPGASVAVVSSAATVKRFGAPAIGGSVSDVSRAVFEDVSNACVGADIRGWFEAESLPSDGPILKKVRHLARIAMAEIS